MSPARSKSQQRLFAAAAHNATFPKAQALRASTTAAQREDFATGSLKGKPEHVRGPNRYGHLAKSR